jgi:hypothetical protein
MSDVERAIRDSIALYQRNPVFVLPHLVEAIVTLGVVLSMAITILLAIGISVANIDVEDPFQLAAQISQAGLGLIAVIILTLILGIFAAALLKAGALAGVVGMAQHGFKDEKVSFRLAIEKARKYLLDIFLFWIFLGLLVVILFFLAFLPVAFSAVFGLPETLAVGATIFSLFGIFGLSLVLYINLMFVPQFIVVTGKGVFDPMKMSYRFVRENKGSVLIYIAIVVVFNIFLFGFFGIISLLPNLLFGETQLLRVFFEIFLLFLRIGVSLVAAPFFEIVKTRMIL